jgi:uncharacterized protein (DUF885 family)
MSNLSYQKYDDDINYIWQNTPKNTKKKKYYLTDDLSDEYLIKYYNIYLKYKKTKDIDLKFELEYVKNYFKYRIYLYFIICSYYNTVTTFYFENKNATNKEKKLIEYNNIIKTIIKRLKEGLKLNITIPHMICVKFMDQIKSYNPILYNFLKNNYLNKCRKTIGLCYLPNGKKIYKTLLKLYLGGLKKTPKKIHNLGLSLLKNIKISKQPNDYYTSKEKLFKDCKKLALYIYDHIIDKYFHYKPDKPFTIKKLPKQLEKTHALAEYDPYVDAVRINLSYYKEISKSSLYSLLMHECFHQYQDKFMNFYKLKDYEGYDYSNISMFEGFAHYMEIYCNYDYDDYYSILRKLRLVVDTGINYYGWSYEKAYNFMIKYLPDNKDDIINEIERFICNPSQSLCYVIGKMEIIKMRDKFLKEKKGSIKDFHHKLLILGMPSFITINKYL